MSMNAYLLFITALLVLDWALDATVDWLNVRSSSPSLPSEFRDIYDADRYRKSQRYQSDNSRFGLIRKTFALTLTLGFIHLQGFEALDLRIRGLGLGNLGTGLAFVGALALLRLLVQLPFAAYHTFVIEERYGFNKTRPGTFAADLAKGLFLGALLGAPLFAGIVTFFDRLGPGAWVWAWLAAVAFQLLIAVLAPVLLMPLFNKFTPLGEGELKDSIQTYLRAQDFEVGGIFTMDGSKRSTKANAFFTGIGRFRRLVFFDTLLEKHTREELTAVLAHEIGHFKLKHIPKGLALSIIASAAVFFLMSLFLNNPELFGAFGMSHLSTYASLVFIGFLYAPLARAFAVLGNGLSRRFEYEADAYAARTYGRPEALALALKKLSRDSMSNLTPHPLKVLLEYTHPPVLSRIQALRKLASGITLEKTGEIL